MDWPEVDKKVFQFFQYRRCLTRTAFGLGSSDIQNLMNTLHNSEKGKNAYKTFVILL